MFTRQLKTNLLTMHSFNLVALLVIALFISSQAMADDATQSTDLFILDFELNDLTLNPTIEVEEKRAATLRPMLSDELQTKYGWVIKDLDAESRASAQKGKGYLFDRPQVSGELGRSVGARWVVTGRLHKASFLFVYLKAQLIDTKTLNVKADFVVEVKGAAPKLTRKGIDALALQVSDTINSLLKEPAK